MQKNVIKKNIIIIFNGYKAMYSAKATEFNTFLNLNS